MNNSAPRSSNDSGHDEPGLPDLPDLIDRLRRHDEKAFEVVVQRYRKRAYTTAYAMLGDEAEAMDVVQEAFIRVFKTIGAFKGESSFYTWFHRIVTNLAIDRLRRRKTRQTQPLTYINDEGEDEGEERHEADGINNPDRVLESGQLRVDLNRALSELSPDHRAVIMLREVDGLSYIEIAEVTNCSIGTVMSRLFYARKKLQERLKEHL